MDFAALLDLLNKYGFPLIISGAVLYYGWKISNEIFRLVQRKLRADQRPQSGELPAIGKKLRKITERDRRPLRTHYFFATTNNLLANKIHTIRCGCEGRTEVFRDMSTVLCRSWSEAMEDFVNVEKTSIDMTADYEFGAQLTDVITRWRRDLKANWLNVNIPKPAVDAMLEWLDARFDVLAHNSAGLASSDFFNDNYERMATVLAIHEMAMQLIIIDMTRLIMSINGNLDNIVYKNLTIMPAKDVLTEYFETKKLNGG
jgi:hypothetical protein